MARKKKAYTWEKSYPKGSQWEVEIKPRPIYHFLDNSAEIYPNNDCLEFEGLKLTYSQVAMFVNRVAQGLQESGVVKGTRVGIFMPNCPYFVISYYAILKAGGIVVNYNPLYAINELVRQVKDSGTSILITLDNTMLYEKASNLLRSTSLEKVIIGCIADMLPFPKNKLLQWFRRDQIASVHYGKINIALESFLDLPGEVNYVPIKPETDIAVLQYTGGTTGTPKGAMLTHANVYSNAMQCSIWFSGLEAGKERMMAVLPFFHVFAMTAIMNLSILSGFEIILMPKFSLKNLLRDIDKKKPTILLGVPTLFSAINNFPKLKNYDLSSLKASISGGASLPLEIKTKFEELSNCIVIEGYGLSESSPVVCSNPLNGENRAGSIGLPIPGTIVEIREPEGSKKLVKNGNIGELCVTGPQVMLGYWNNEKETKNVLKAGRLHTGDLGYMDEDGYIYIVDRIKDLIIVSGFNVYPREIEELLYKHVHIEEAAVIGLPDKHKGERIKAFIKLKAGKKMEAKEVREYLEGRLAKYKLPDEVEFIESVPKTIIGKVAKRELKEKK